MPQRAARLAAIVPIGNRFTDAVATTYVIGAGASRHAKYPLASEMGKRLIEFMLGMDQHP
jgi:hypothetical protein